MLFTAGAQAEERGSPAKVRGVTDSSHILEGTKENILSIVRCQAELGREHLTALQKSGQERPRNARQERGIE